MTPFSEPFLVFLLLQLPYLSFADSGRFNDAYKEHYRNRYNEFPKTASLGDSCDPAIHNTYVKPIYESIISFNLAQTIQRENALIEHIKGNSDLQKKVCYGFMPKRIFTDYTASIAKYYDCQNGRCVCLDQEPLKHVPSTSPESVTGCTLVEPKLGSRCDRRVFDTEQKNQFDGIFKLFHRAKDLSDHRNAAAQWYGTDAYTYTILQSHYALRQQICLDNNWSLVCSDTTLQLYNLKESFETAPQKLS